MDPPRGEEAFLAGDPRAGAYRAGVIYLVGHHLTEEQAVALIDSPSGGYVWATDEEARAALAALTEPEAEPDAPATDEEV
jgi:hypothetical protein